MKIKYNRLHQQEGRGEYSLKIVSQYFNHDIDKKMLNVLYFIFIYCASLEAAKETPISDRLGRVHKNIVLL